jgi:predicted ester cyclase
LEVRFMATTQTIFDEGTSALNSHDYAKFESLHDSNADVWQAGIPGKDIKSQIDSMKVLAAGFPDGRWTYERPIRDGEQTSAELRFEGTHTATLSLPAVPEIAATGKKVSLNASVVLTVRDGKVTRSRVYTDRMQLVEQLGLAPAPQMATV